MPVSRLTSCATSRAVAVMSSIALIVCSSKLLHAILSPESCKGMQAKMHMLEYMRDGVYFSWIVLALCLLSDWLFLLLLVMPVFVIYKLVGAMPSAPSGPEEDDSKRKAPKKVSKLTKAERMAMTGAEYRGGKRKF